MAGTECRDDRAVFAGTGGRIPAAFQDLPTPCYILDERALRRNGEILGKLAWSLSTTLCLVNCDTHGVCNLVSVHDNMALTVSGVTAVSGRNGGQRLI